MCVCLYMSESECLPDLLLLLSSLLLLPDVSMAHMYPMFMRDCKCIYSCFFSSRCCHIFFARLLVSRRDHKSLARPVHSFPPSHSSSSSHVLLCSPLSLLYRLSQQLINLNLLDHKPTHTQTAVLLLRIDDIVSGSKKKDGGSGAGMQTNAQPTEESVKDD